MRRSWLWRLGRVPVLGRVVLPIILWQHGRRLARVERLLHQFESL